VSNVTQEAIKVFTDRVKILPMLLKDMIKILTHDVSNMLYSYVHAPLSDQKAPTGSKLQLSDDDFRLTGGDVFGGNVLIDVIHGNGTDDFLLTTGRTEDEPTTTGMTSTGGPHFVPYFSELRSRLLPAALGNLCSTFYGNMDSLSYRKKLWSRLLGSNCSMPKRKNYSSKRNPKRNPMRHSRTMNIQE
jgi:hypothetical protein